MCDETWKVAIIDSGLDRDSELSPLACRRFLDDGDTVRALDTGPDPTGHGSAVACVIAGDPSAASLLVAQVIDVSGRTTPAAVAAALMWARLEGAQLIHMSLGLRHDRAVLADAVRELIEAGIVIVASAPARGVRTYPANYDGVIRATGDARCSAPEISWLDTSHADFGGYGSFHAKDAAVMRGASIGAAHVSRFIVSHLKPTSGHRAVRAALARLATHRGPERRGLPGAASQMAQS